MARWRRKLCIVKKNETDDLKKIIMNEEKNQNSFLDEELTRNNEITG